MLLLDSTSDIIKVITVGATVALDVHADWVDKDGTTITPGSANHAQIVTAATDTIVAAPSGTAIRNVKALRLTNRNASASISVQLQHYDGTTSSNIYPTFSLLAGYCLTYDEGFWQLSDASGAPVATPLSGRMLLRTVLTSASANHTVGPATNSIFIRGVAGGGAGGGCTSVSAACSAAGGGGAGGYVEKTFAVTPNTAYAYTCGAGGTGSAGAAGGDGANSTFIVGATTVTAIKGLGGPQAVSATTLKAFLGGAGGTVSTNGDVNGAGEPGSPGFVLIVNSGTTEIQCSGNGGSTAFGGGGIGLITSGAGATGVNAAGFGAGGGGSCTGASQTRAGGNGTAGCWIVEEYS